MAKNFPYFKFVATEWLTGNIAFEDLEVQGLFINICSLYWQRDGVLTLEELKRRYKREDLIDKLIEGDFLGSDEDSISIQFLDEQLVAANHVSKQNSENGKKGAIAKALKIKEKQATAKDSPSGSQANLSKEEEEKEKKKKDNTSNATAFDFDNLLAFINKSFGRNFKLINQSVKKSFNARLKDGYSKKDIIVCIENLVKNQYHKENGYQYCTPEFLSRSSTLEKYGTKTSVLPNKNQIQQTPSTDSAIKLAL